MLNPLVSVNDAARLLGVSKWSIFVGETWENSVPSGSAVVSF